MDLDCVEKVQKWVEFDNTILKNKEHISSVIENKKILEEEILNYVESNDMNSITISVTDGNIKFPKVTSTQSLNNKNLKILIHKYNTENEANIPVDDLVNFIYKNLEKKSSIGIKRTISQF